jgi:hypothetical protein
VDGTHWIAFCRYFARTKRIRRSARGRNHSLPGHRNKLKVPSLPTNPVAFVGSNRIFKMAQDHLKKMLARVLGQLLEAKIVNDQRFRLEVTPQGSVLLLDFPRNRATMDRALERACSLAVRRLPNHPSERIF